MVFFANNTYSMTTIFKGDFRHFIIRNSAGFPTNYGGATLSGSGQLTVRNKAQPQVRLFTTNTGSANSPSY